MGLLSNLLNNREITRLEELALRSPAPSVFIRLNQLYSETGNESQANATVKRGLDYFPENEELIIVNRQIVTAEHAVEKDRLKLQIEQYPNPSLYAKLAAIYLAEDNFAECEEICSSCLDDFADNGGIYLILAQLADKKGEQDVCIEMLKKTAELDKYNYTGLFMLAEKYRESGDLVAAEEVLNDILEFSPDNQKVKGILENLHEEVEEVTEEEETKVVDSSERPTEQVDMSKASLKASSASITGVQQLEKTFDKIAKVEGVRECILMDKSGLVIESNIEDSDQEQLFAALVTNIYRSSVNCSEPLMLGEFEDGILESSSGSIYLMSTADMLIAVFADLDAKSGLLQRAIHNFAQKITQN
ncbi:MAG: roadblock/LC7 domain-containing protein [Planctomycetota bacterium]|jgi:predicted regulator of Ras-like GTPase activity (Roadblock/LC7/MglB family)